jgi:hypothetical protein
MVGEIPATSMMSRKYPSPTCPVQARWNSSLTEMRPLAIQRIRSWPPLAKRWCSACSFAFNSTVSPIAGPQNMRNTKISLNRRRFIGSTTLLGIASIFFPRVAVRGEIVLTKPRGARGLLMNDSAAHSSGKDGQRIVWTSTTCHGGNAPCLNADGHPTFDNPYGWTIEQMDDIYNRFLRPQSMTFTIKWMGLASYMKEGPYAAVRTQLESQIHD